MASEPTQQERRKKAEAFLWIIQAGLLLEAGRIRRADTVGDGMKAADYSGSGLFIRADEAVRAAGLIPGEMSVADAAKAFCAFYAAPERPRDVPSWFARYGQEQYDYSVVSKADQFLWIVQTSVLADGEYQASIDARAKKPERIAPTTAIETMAQAIRVAGTIPPEINVTEAASEFLAFYAPGMKERRSAPKWCRVQLSPSSER